VDEPAGRFGPLQKLGRELHCPRLFRRARERLSDGGNAGCGRAHTGGGPGTREEVPARAHSMPSSFIRRQSVLRLIPSVSAARPRFQWEVSRT